jgi:hypothetical protein
MESAPRVIISDRYGALYLGSDGTWQPTPNFGMLLIDGHSQHNAQDPTPAQVRTRVQVTRDRIKTLFLPAAAPAESLFEAIKKLSKPAE